MSSHFEWIGKSKDGETIVLKRFSGDFRVADYATPSWIEMNAELVRTGAVLDTETTGMNRRSDKVIEIGLRTFQFNKQTGELLSLRDSYSGLEDPGTPLSPEIQLITGLTDDDVRGKQIDWKEVDRLISASDIIIAHNASFDRPFVEKKSTASQKKIWGCSVKQIDWLKRGFPSAKLELLSVWHGFFTDAHRALNDADALLNVLSYGALIELLNNAKKPQVKMVATNSPFESKDALKERGYSWDSDARVWKKTILKEGFEEELGWMEKAVYGGTFRGQAIDIPLFDNFK